MPQLDIGIFWLNLSFNSLCFWFIYFFLLSKIFQNLNKLFRLRFFWFKQFSYVYIFKIFLISWKYSIRLFHKNILINNYNHILFYFGDFLSLITFFFIKTFFINKKYSIFFIYKIFKFYFFIS